MGIKQSKEELEVFKQKAMRAYAKANKISILIFIRESYSHELVAVSVQERTDYKATLTILSVDYIMCLASNAPMTSAVVPLLMMK